MDHFPRFRRQKKDAATPAAPEKSAIASKTTPPTPILEPLIPPRPSPKPSPFRNFHLRTTQKRTREASPASLPPVSPTTSAGMTHTGGAGDAEEPSSPNAKSPITDGTTSQPTKPSGPRKSPAFLELSEREVEHKFEELVWLERNRLLQSMQNPSPDFRWARVSGQYKSLDRYMNIQPWQNNRVKLQVPEGQVDYINASPIVLMPTASPPSQRMPDHYIAMQGPKQASVDHVWRMVVEQLGDPGVVVMLTETHEGAAEKCYQYFPRRPEDGEMQVNARDEFGDGFRAAVRCEALETTAAGDAIEVRKLVVRVLSRGQPSQDQSKQNDGGDDRPSTSSPTSDVRDGVAQLATTSGAASPVTSEPEDQNAVSSPPQTAAATAEDVAPEAKGSAVEERIIWHLLYKKWPDFGVPDLADMDSFLALMRLSRDKNGSADSPRVVHCSAGVGRSGTFIALDHLSRELDAGVFESDPSPAADPEPPTPADEDEDAEPGSAMEPDAAAADPIFATVNALREQRRTMVQAEAQYLFVYQVMRKLWRDKYGAGGADEAPREAGGAGTTAGKAKAKADSGEPAPKRLEVDPFVEKRAYAPSAAAAASIMR